MYEYTGYYGLRDQSSPLPVDVTAAGFADAAMQLHAWRARKAANPVQHTLISAEPIRIVNETIRAEWPE